MGAYLMCNVEEEYSLRNSHALTLSLSFLLSQRRGRDDAVEVVKFDRDLVFHQGNVVCPSNLCLQSGGEEGSDLLVCQGSY